MSTLWNAFLTDKYKKGQHRDVLDILGNFLLVVGECGVHGNNSR